MKVILKPISHPQMGEISIADDLFAIGRNEEPFASRLGEAAARLSRRHARIFQEDGKVFIVDLGSLNGTRHNEQPLKNGAAILQSNDTIMLGDEVSFRVEIEREPHNQTLIRTSPVRLTLVPVHAGSGIETITIERFPFLIARIDSAFEQYKERFPDALRKISRRHAVIALKGEEIYIEDLESSNGTYVCGARLDERAHRLTDGDTVSFGSEQFAYQARVESQAEATRMDETLMASPDKTVMPPAADPGAPAADSNAPADNRPANNRQGNTGNRTRFVSSADSFLNVFCAENQEAEAADRSEDAGETAKVRSPQVPAGKLQKARAMFGQLWRALSGQPGVDRRLRWGAAAVLGLIVVVAAGNYLLGIDRREIKALLDEGKYSESAGVANRYLERNPDDEVARAWAQEALAKAIVPAWVTYIGSGRFDDAATYLKAQGDAHGFIRDGQKMIDTLSWAGAIEAHMADRGGPSGPITLFRHEDAIKSLVESWDKDSFTRQQIMDQIVTRVPAFESVHGQVYSDLRTLRSENALYVKAIAELKAAVRSALEKSDSQGTGQSIDQGIDKGIDQSIDKSIDKSIGRLLTEFAANYPRVSGVDALSDDLTNYGTLLRLAQEKQLLELVRESRTTKFRTPLFAQHVDGWLARSLPPPQILAKHTAAAAAWADGKHDEAVAILKPLTNEPWGEVAARQIARYQKTQADYDALLASRGSDAYWDNLLVVWGSLRPNEDAHLIRTLEPDFLAHREQLIPRLGEALRRARSNWDDYQNAGGIPGVIRVEERISERFSGQAKRLSSACDEITRGARTWQLLQLNQPPEWRSLEEQIVTEVQRQRQWLQDLDIVLEPALLRAKLELLPEAPEKLLWASSTTDQRKD